MGGGVVMVAALLVVVVSPTPKSPPPEGGDLLGMTFPALPGKSDPPLLGPRYPHTGGTGPSTHPPWGGECKNRAMYP